MHAWAFTDTPEEAEVIFRRRLAYDLSRPSNFSFGSPDKRKDVARRVSTRNFEVEIDSSYCPGTTIQTPRRTENKE